MKKKIKQARHFSHITNDDRIAISYLRNLNTSLRDIAKQIHKDYSAVSREINRNKDPVTGKYLYGKADKLSKNRRLEINSTLIKITGGSRLEEYIISKLKLNWSPEQISGRMKREQKVGLINLEHTVSHETIYNYIQTKRPDLKLLLRCNKGKYRRKYRTKIRERDRKKKELEKIRIDKRPDIVETRERIGDWEGDTIVGEKQIEHIMTHVERKSGYLLADKLEVPTAEETSSITIKRFNTLPKDKVQTITYDNGSLFARYATTQMKLHIRIYFAYPYHSWERGTNENTNGLLRQYYPKKSSFKNITQEQLDQTVNLINTRPRKRLNYSTPEEIFKGVALRN